MIPFVRACTDPRYRRVIGVLSSQTGKSEAVLNVAGHRLEDDPVPILYVGPTRSNLEKVIEPRFMAMVRSARSLRHKIGLGHQSTKTYKRVSGVSFRLAWAGSATELASEPACLVIVDERDRMEDDVGGEGDPVELAEARNATYPDGKALVVSSPTIGNVESYVHPETGFEHWRVAEGEDLSSQIWKLWQEGTRHEWAWPCPECDQYFIPRFKFLWWPDKSTPQQALKLAKLTCPHCGTLVGEEKKKWMNDRGVFVAPGQKVVDGKANGEIPESDCASFWVSGLCSPWRTWGARARSWLSAVRSGEPERIQGVLNTGFGELYRVSGEAPDWQLVAACRREYDFDAVPAGVQRIVCAVDVQKNRLEYLIRGFGYKYESWLIRQGQIWGETEFNAVWDELAQFKELRFQGRTIDRMLIDSGYRPGITWQRPDNQIYAFSRRFVGWAFATKGHDKQEKPLRSSWIDVTLKGKTIKNGLQLWHIDTDHYKQWVHSRIEWPDGEPGGWYLARETTDDYCMQVVAEARVPKPSGHVVWMKVRRENHALDLESMSVAGADMLKVWSLKNLVEKKEKQPRAPVTIKSNIQSRFR